MLRFVSALLFIITLNITTLTATSADGAGTSSNPWDKAPDYLVEPIKLIDDEKYNKAIEQLTVLMETRSNDADVQNLLGFSHRKLEDFEQAVLFYNTALSIDPSHKGALEYLGELYVETNQLELANAQLEKLNKLCTFCKERRNLKKAIRNHKSS